MESLKFQFVEQNMKKMLAPLKLNQNFLRYTQYLSDYPLDSEIYDSEGNTIEQPDIVSNDLIADKIIIPTLFNPVISVESKVYLFFSPLRGSINSTKNALMENRYIFDIIVPFANYTLGTGEFRPFRIANEICKCLDWKNIAGVGKTFMYDYSINTVNETYLGMRLYFKINDPAVQG